MDSRKRDGFGMHDSPKMHTNTSHDLHTMHICDENFNCEGSCALRI